MRKLSILLTFILVLVSVTACTQDKTDSAVENGSIEEPTAKMKMKN